MSAALKSSMQLWQRFHLVNSHKPSFRGVSLFEVSQLEVFQPNDRLAHRIEAWLLIHTCANLSESVVAESVHETVDHGFGGCAVDSILSIGVEVVFLHVGENSS